MNMPRIAIPVIVQDVRNYTSAVFAAGMEPVVISAEREQLQGGYQQEYLDYSQFHQDAYDGLLLPGGVDINPRRYGQENEGSSSRIMDELDDLQLSILDDFIRHGKPVLGICRGMQLLNIYFGGTLTQHLPTFFRHFRPLDSPEDKKHNCHAEKGCWLEKLYGSEFVQNSSHHQGVDRPGRDLIIDSLCPEDGVIEALHHQTLPIYGVQWHPERTCLKYARPEVVNGLAVYRFFCKLCGGTPESYLWREQDGMMDGSMGL